jgi:hypothetical protein
MKATILIPAVLLPLAFAADAVAQNCRELYVVEDRNNPGTFNKSEEEVTNDFLASDFTVPGHESLKGYYYPNGRMTTWSGAPNEGALNQIDSFGPVFEPCCDCANTPNTLNNPKFESAFQLLVFSKDQDPRLDPGSANRKFDKPILVVQGFDADWGGGSQFNFGTFVLALNTMIDDFGRFTGAPGMLQDLYDKGYDIALMLWRNPNAPVENNAKSLAQALRWLVDHSQDTGAEPVVIGPSLGGIVARYALQKAGANFANSGIKASLLIAFDSPNLGAEIPMSLQALVLAAGHPDAESAQGKMLFRNLTSPAAREMLLSTMKSDHPHGETRQSVTDYQDPNTEHGRFYAELNSPVEYFSLANITRPVCGGAPEPMYTAALLNGSGTGQGHELESGLTYAKQTLIKGNITLTSSVENQEILVADIDPFGGSVVGVASTQYKFQEPVFMEDVPGGTRSSYGQIHRADGFVWEKFDSRFIFNGHAFVPSRSAAGLLGLFQENVNSPAFWRTPTGLLGRHRPMGIFDEFRAPLTNQMHMDITAETKGWFIELIEKYGPHDPAQCALCGAEGQSCCGRASCGSGLACDHFQDRDICAPCGGNTQLCCPGTSKCPGALPGETLVCDTLNVDPVNNNPDSFCIQCGGQFEACCEGARCDGGLTCDTTMNGSLGECLPNLVVDPGFEASSSLQNTWQIEGPDGHGVDSGIGFAHTGWNNAWIRASSFEWNALRQHVVVEPNKNYVLTAWVQTSDNFPATGRFGVRTGNTSNVLAETPFEARPGYTKLSVEFFSDSLTSVEVFWGNWAQGVDSWMRLDDLALRVN